MNASQVDFNWRSAKRLESSHTREIEKKKRYDIERKRKILMDLYKWRRIDLQTFQVFSDLGSAFQQEFQQGVAGSQRKQPALLLEQPQSC